MNNIHEQINDVLAVWNPIGVPDLIAHDEYRGYVGSIHAIGADRAALSKKLQYLLVNILGLEYNSDDSAQREDLQNVVNNLYNILNVQ